MLHLTDAFVAVLTTARLAFAAPQYGPYGPIGPADPPHGDDGTANFYSRADCQNPCIKGSDGRCKDDSTKRLEGDLQQEVWGAGVDSWTLCWDLPTHTRSIGLTMHGNGRYTAVLAHCDAWNADGFESVNTTGIEWGDGDTDDAQMCTHRKKLPRGVKAIGYTSTDADCGTTCGHN